MRVRQAIVVGLVCASLPASTVFFAFGFTRIAVAVIAAGFAVEVMALRVAVRGTRPRGGR